MHIYKYILHISNQKIIYFMLFLKQEKFMLIYILIC